MTLVFHFTDTSYILLTWTDRFLSTSMYLSDKNCPSLDGQHRYRMRFSFITTFDQDSRRKSSFSRTSKLKSSVEWRDEVASILWDAEWASISEISSVIDNLGGEVTRAFQVFLIAGSLKHLLAGGFLLVGDFLLKYFGHAGNFVGIASGSRRGFSRSNRNSSLPGIWLVRKNLSINCSLKCFSQT